jgi:hypothetical protein
MKYQKPKKFTVEDGQELIEVMEGVGYSYAEIREKFERKRKKYGTVRRKVNEIKRPPSEEEIKRNQQAEKVNQRRKEVREEMIRRWKEIKS